MENKKIALMLTPIERKVLDVLEKNTLEELSKKTKLSKTEIMRGLQWLENKKLCSIKKEEAENIILGKLGEEYVKKGLPEIQLLKELKDEEELGDVFKKSKLDKQEINVALGKLRENAAVSLNKENGKTIVKKLPNSKNIISKGTIEQKFLEKLPINKEGLDDEQKYAYSRLQKRKEIIDIEIIKTVKAKITNKGIQIKKEKIDSNLIEKLTPSMIKNKKWEGKKFRHYDVEINVPPIAGGRKHPTREVIEFVKQIWLDMGFVEMKGRMLETSFWNFDALFIPQDHPAREMQDALFSDLREEVKRIKQYNKVKKQNQKSWRVWEDEETKKLVLRTHTTSLSAKTISELKEKDLPKKFFSVGKVFRNEALDWNHLFEFYQVEGIVVDPDVTFNDLVGYLKIFFKKMGFDKIRIRPAYFPYTLESAECEVFHPKKQKWIELGGAGILRPEVVKPLMGVDVPVLAWGLGLGRIMMDYYEVDNLREFYRNNTKKLESLKSWIR